MQDKPEHHQDPADGMSQMEAEPAMPATEEGRRREPVFNLPGVITVLIGIFAAIHLVRTYLISADSDAFIILVFSFIPLSYTALASQLPVPISGLWSPVTHGFLHGDWLHLGVNSIWMAAFGSPLARRFGAIRFLILTAICMAAGALAHYLAYASLFVPVIGASGAVSGYMGAAGRFAFTGARGPRGLRHDGPALSILQSLQNQQFLVFAGIWMVFNYLFGSGVVSMAGQQGGIAWQAHIGGFLAGFFLFSLLDPRRRLPGA